MVVADKPILLGFWGVVAVEKTWDHELAKGNVSAIKDPLHKYLHRLICTSITARGKSRDWCTSGDLFFLYCLLYKKSCALAHALAQYFASVYHRQQLGKLYGGADVTVIACSFGYHLNADLRLLPAIEPKRLGMSTIWRMKLIRMSPVIGRRFRTTSGDPFIPVPLPEHFEPVYPPALLEGVLEHPPITDFPELPQPRPPPGPPKFPHHVVPGPGRGALKYQQLRADVDMMSYTLRWLVEEAQEANSVRGYYPGRTIRLQDNISSIRSNNRIRSDRRAFVLVFVFSI